jgi:hypothetical protein
LPPPHVCKHRPCLLLHLRACPGHWGRHEGCGVVGQELGAARLAVRAGELVRVGARTEVLPPLALPAALRASARDSQRWVWLRLRLRLPPWPRLRVRLLQLQLGLHE